MTSETFWLSIRRIVGLRNLMLIRGGASAGSGG